jgi:hypothetical protein
MPALDPHLVGSDRVREVFARVHAGDDSVADLFAPDAVLLYGSDGRLEGRQAIRAFYARTIETIHPRPHVDQVFEAPPRYVAVVDVPTSRGRQHAVDLFELGDEGIVSLEIHARTADEPG